MKISNFGKTYRTKIREIEINCSAVSLLKISEHPITLYLDEVSEDERSQIRLTIDEAHNLIDRLNGHIASYEKEVK